MAKANRPHTASPNQSKEALSNTLEEISSDTSQELSKLEENIKIKNSRADVSAHPELEDLIAPFLAVTLINKNSVDIKDKLPKRKKFKQEIDNDL